MKKTLLFASLLLSLNAVAQSPIQSFYSINPIMEEDNITNYVLVTPSSPLEHGDGGQDVVWNFDNLSVVTTTSTTVLYPNNEALTNYPGTTMVVETITEGGNPTFYYLSDNGQGTNIKGFETSQMSLKYDGGGLVGYFPMSANEQVSGSVSGTYNANGLEGTFIGNAGSTANAYGTLTVNQGFSGTKNVTRLTTYQYLTLRYMGADIGTLQQTIYGYYSADLIVGPVMRSITTQMVIPSAGINQTQTTIEIYDEATNGVNSHNAFAKIIIAPNPVQDVLHIAGDAQIDEITITDTMGRVALKSKGTDVDVSHLAKGIYMVTASSQIGIKTLKMVKQ